MSASHRVLGTLRLEVQFELAEATAAAARVIAEVASIEQQVIAEERHCNEHARQLRDVTSRSRMNPALIQSSQRLHRAAQRSLHEGRYQLRMARDHEAETRRTLSALLDRERSLEKAMQVGRRKQQLERQRREWITADACWLQHAFQGQS